MEPILHELLLRWQDEPDREPEELCQDHPELLPVLREQIAILRRFEQLVEETVRGDAEP